MRLIIGGAGQGKLAYALAQSGLSRDDVLHGADCPLELTAHPAVLDGYHALVRRLLRAELDACAYTERLLDENPDVIVLCDEVGCGVVPLDAFERRWREETGRLCCLIAGRAGRVERVYCGIAQTIKGD